MRSWLAFALMLLAGPLAPAQEAPTAGENNPPAIEHETPGCVAPGRRPKLCALVLDDRGVGRVRAVFRALGTKGYYWTPMAFDGARYCAWLPRPASETRGVEYYIEAFDDEYEMSRSRNEALEVRPACPPTEGEATAAPSAVGTTAPGQEPSPPGFDPPTFRPGA